MASAIVIGFLGVTSDQKFKINYACEPPSSSWRPTVSIFENQKNLLELSSCSRISELHLLVPSDRDYSETIFDVSRDCQLFCPDLKIFQHAITGNVWDYDDMLNSLLQFFTDLKRQPAVEYYIHMSTGTHVSLICLHTIIDAGIFPALFLQTIPPHLRKDSQCLKIVNRFSSPLIDYAREKAISNVAFLNKSTPSKSPAYNALSQKIELVAINSGANILLLGESGVGKTFIAQRIFELRQVNGLSKVFAQLNCATLRGDLVSSTLFGHIKGAFTGADKNKVGLLEKVNGGTLFLDEIGDLGLNEQAMLLKAIEEHEFLPVGGDKPIKSHFQLIAGTNKDLLQLVQQGFFRRDLFARIAVWSFELPPLRNRKEDIPNIIDSLINNQTKIRNILVSLDDDAKHIYYQFATSLEATWPLNWRDLSASIERMATLARHGRISKEIVINEISNLKNQWNRLTCGQATIKTDLELSRQLNIDLAKFNLEERYKLRALLEACRGAKGRADAGRKLLGALTDTGKENYVNYIDRRLSNYGLDFNFVRKL